MKMKNFLKKVTFLTILYSLLITLGFIHWVSAETKALHYKDLSIQVFPEFTKHPNPEIKEPSLLIGYHGTILNANEEIYNDKIVIPIPLNSPNFSLGYIGENAGNGTMGDLEYMIDRDHETITITPGKPIGIGEEFKFVVEYYHTPIKQAGRKSFSYSFNADLDIERASIVIYKPLGAEDFKIDPNTNYQLLNDYGMELYIFEYSELKTGDELTFNIDYLKNDDITTLERFEQIHPPNDAIHAGLNNTDNPSDDKQSLITGSDAVMISISILILGMFIYFVQRNRAAHSQNDHQKELNQINKNKEIKNLRRSYADGEIDENMYLEKLSQIKQDGSL